MRRQRNVLALSAAHFGAVVNAAGGSGASGFPARGGSLIVSREGGHEKPAPPGIEHYLPYQTSIVTGAGAGETILYATRRTGTRNSQDIDRYWRNRNRKSRAETGWHDWIKVGAAAVGGDTAK